MPIFGSTWSFPILPSIIMSATIQLQSYALLKQQLFNKCIESIFFICIHTQVQEPLFLDVLISRNLQLLLHAKAYTRYKHWLPQQCHAPHYTMETKRNTHRCLQCKSSWNTITLSKHLTKINIPLDSALTNSVCLSWKIYAKRTLSVL
jgi:hypothetical protein